MRAGSVIRKDLKVYVRHRKTLLLIFLAPILIMVLIGSVFSGGGTGDDALRNVRLGVVGGSEQGRQIIEELNQSGRFIIIKEDTRDPSVLEKGVRAGKYRAGIFIPGNETQSLRLYLDNSKIQVAPVISTIFVTTTEKMSYEMTLGFITRLWKNLGEMESELSPLEDNISRVNGSIAELNAKTGRVIATMDEINVTAMNESTAMMKTTLESMSAELSNSAGGINATRQELAEMRENVSSIYEDSSGLRDDLRFVLDNIDATDASLLSMQSDLQNTYDATCAATPSAPGCVSVTLTIQRINETRGLITERTARIRSLYIHLDSLSRRSGELLDRLNRTDAGLAGLQGSMANYTTEISNISSSMGSIDNSTALLGNVKKQADTVSSQMEKLAFETSNGSSELVSDIERTRSVLRDVIAREPGFVAAPVKLESEQVFRGRTNLDFLMPGIVSIVLMFVSFLLASITIVQERARKTLTRTLLTPLSLAGFIVEKTAALLIIAQVQGVIMLIVAYLVYNVVIPTDQMLQLFIAILVYSAAFIGIGMALATFAESENTAMLSSLVLSIPMLFLSGIFFPFETMPDFMVGLGSALPITMGIRALESVLIYQESANAVASHLLPLVAYSITGLAVAYMLLRKEIME